MKKKINFIDLDNTLLPYNSFTRFVFYFMMNLKLFFPLLFLSFLRIIGFKRRDSYQKSVLLLTRKIPDYELKLKDFSLLLYRDIKTSIQQVIQDYTDENTINVLCTASPEDYVHYFCEKLKDWKYLCSTLDKQSGSFYHMYGPNKLEVFTTIYKKDFYKYNVGLSDSKTDLDLLRLFDVAFLIKKNKFIKLK